MKEFKGDKLNRFFWKYEEALKFLENLVGSFMSSVDASDEHNPIEHCSGRIKSIDSINNKLMKRGLEFNEYKVLRRFLPNSKEEMIEYEADSKAASNIGKDIAIGALRWMIDNISLSLSSKMEIKRRIV